MNTACLEYLFKYEQRNRAHFLIHCLHFLAKNFVVFCHCSLNSVFVHFLFDIGNKNVCFWRNLGSCWNRLDFFPIGWLSCTLHLITKITSKQNPHDLHINQLNNNVFFAFLLCTLISSGVKSRRSQHDPCRN